MESGVESIKSFIKLFEEKENCELFYFTKLYYSIINIVKI